MFDSCSLVVGLPVYSISTLIVDMVTVDMAIVADSIIVSSKKNNIVDRVFAIEVVVFGKTILVDEWCCIDFE